MNKKNLVWLGKTVLFFSLVGGCIGSIFATATMSNLWQGKGVIYGGSLFLLGYALIGIPVAGFSGLIYATLRLASKSASQCSISKQFLFGLISWLGILCLAITDGYFSDFDRIKGPITFAFLNAISDPRAIFLLACVATTIFLHSLAVSAYDLFRYEKSDKTPAGKASV